jgi:molecular chaperone DnaK
MSSTPLAVGIDLGTTYSVLATLDGEGRPITLTNGEGDRSTPSVVLFEGETVTVGKEALKALALEPARVAECSKRDMGQRVYHKLIDGKHYPPEVIGALILNKLRTDAAAQLGAVEKAVITVPAYFDEVRRKATQDAGYMAGLEVIDIINEPTAAAVAFGFHHGFVAGGDRDKPHRVLVYDLGGGTFDVTVMEIRGSDYRTLATDGDVQLGGYDWDQRLVRLVAEGFERRNQSDPRDDSVAAARLWRDCEEAKRTLSSRIKANVHCEYRGRSARIELAREQFEEATADLLDRTRFTMNQTLRAAGLEWKDVDRVLLTGGSTRMPMVRKMVREVAGREPDTSIAADEAVAHGAALRAGLLLAESQGKRPGIHIRNVNSHSLGVIGVDPQTARKRNCIIVPRNTPIPCSSQRIFRTQKQGQRSVLVEVVEGENPSPEECTAIGRCAVRKLPRDIPAGTSIEVQFDYGSDGRLKVQVRVNDANKEIQTEFARENTLSQEHLDGWRRFISGTEPANP